MTLDPRQKLSVLKNWSHLPSEAFEVWVTGDIMTG
eukprot:CAMPEP_0115861368 /NCGR_PEP_ID=MMETSP0287-20121206/17616_1 /TAXON_ID=412157 /ORGANISM="Chrysochromulina rotalis, Strain UIO044" /LENGTH=34 /DNA_ID= /DNA_START= /DNA_END= /DNA_ORIENTATION=